MQFCMYACLILVSWFGARMIVSRTLTTGQLMSLMTYAIQILSSLMMLSMVFVMITIPVPPASVSWKFWTKKAISSARRTLSPK